MQQPMSDADLEALERSVGLGDYRYCMHEEVERRDGRWSTITHFSPTQDVGFGLTLVCIHPAHEGMQIPPRTRVIHGPDRMTASPYASLEAGYLFDMSMRYRPAG